MNEHQLPTHGIVHAGFSGSRAFVARKKGLCKLIGNRFVIPHDTIPSTVSCKHMEQHYFGGYYLIKLKPIDFGDDLKKTVWTCSGCINSLAFDAWALSWMGEKPDKKVKRDLQITDEKITEIQQWSDSKFEDGINDFPDLKMAEEFKTLFFESSNDLFYLSINFPETDANLLIDDFAAGNNTETFNYNNGNFDLRKNLLKKNLKT